MWALVILVVVLVALETGASAQPSPTGSGRDPDGQIQILGVEQSEDEVILELAVPPAFGRVAPVDRNFGVTDGGQRVKFTVAPLEGALDTVLVIDTSGSMRGPALAAAKAAARSFIAAVPNDTRVGLVSFGESVLIHQKPTLDRASLLADLDRLDTADGETALWDALVAAADLVDGSAGGQSSVVVLSDGGDTASSATRSDAIERLSSRSTVLYAVAIESPDTDLVALKETVDRVGGQFLTTTDIGELDSLYTEIAGRLAGRYQLRFTSAQQGTRTVVVSVAANGAVATARTTISGAPAASTVDGGDPVPVISVDDLPVLGPVAVPMPGPLAGPTMFWIGVGSIFGAFALAGTLVARRPAHVGLATVTSADRLAGIGSQLGQAADRLVSRHDRENRLDARLDAADINLRPGEFVLVWLLVTSLAGLSASALAGLVFGALVIPTSAVAAFLVLNVRASRRRSRFAGQLIETLGIMANSLRAGQSLPQAIELVATETPSPTAEQFHRIHFEIRVGRDLTESVREAARRMDSRDLEWLAQAVDIHRELGGDLTEILQNVATTIRERRTVARQIDALSAEGRATGWVLLGMPIILFVFGWWKTPESVGRMLTEPTGRVLLAIAVSGMTVGHIWIRHLVKLKF
jgi:tight adherence protein B